MDNDEAWSREAAELAVLIAALEEDLNRVFGGEPNTVDLPAQIKGFINVWCEERGEYELADWLYQYIDII